MEPLDPATAARLQAAALGWYDAAGRSFAFRGTRDPYAVLVSEVILQQTQVSRGEPAWTAFTKRFPSFAALAAASPAEVLRAWAGLGYNRRALALHQTARAVMEQHGGRLPEDTASLRALPGIGPYTARAIQAIAFGRAVGPMDTNVRRVLGRVIAGHGSRWDRGGEMPLARLQGVADALVPAERPADWTAALMDIGSSLCRPRRPDCDACPLAGECRYFAKRGTAAAAAAPAPAPRPRGAREAPAAYESTTRWLRGRIVERLRDLPDGEWTTIEAPLGEHDPAAIEAAVVDLEHEGLLERDVAGRVRLPH